MTVADWAALVITVGWAVTAFLVVHVITRPPPHATDATPGEDRGDDPPSDRTP